MRRLARFGDRTRIAGIVGVAVLLAVGLVVTGDSFSLFVAALLIAAPFLNWRAYFRLRAKRADREALGLSPIYSLRTAYYASLFLAVASTSLALAGLYVVLRAFDLVAAFPRETFLLLLAYPLVLISGPAVEWLILVDELEEETRRLRRRLAELGIGDPDAVAERVVER